MKSMKSLWRRIRSKFYKIHKPKIRGKYQFGAPIVGVYRWDNFMVVATKLDVYITEDGINYVTAKRDI